MKMLCQLNEIINIQHLIYSNMTQNLAINIINNDYYNC